MEFLLKIIEELKSLLYDMEMAVVEDAKDTYSSNKEDYVDYYAEFEVIQKESGDGIKESFSLRFIPDEAVVKLATGNSVKMSEGEATDGVQTNTFTFSSAMWGGGREFTVANPNIAKDIAKAVRAISKQTKMMYNGIMQFTVLEEKHGLGNDGGWSQKTVISESSEEE